MTMATVYGLGLGPGDPDLMTVRADRLLRGARHVAFFRKAGCEGKARSIVADLIPEGATEHPMEYPVTTEIPFDDPRYNEILAAFYADSTARLKALAEAGEDVVVLCEGDPFFYGSFMHLYTRLKDDVAVEVVPGITGMSAAWTASGAPITWGDDVMSVLPGTLPEEVLVRGIKAADAVVVMKMGRHLGKLRRALLLAGRAEDAWIVEYAAMPGQTVTRLADYPGRTAPYFSIVLVHGQGRRP
ncbi:precorrin-2 C(20)-methyltransferase [Rhodovulum sulfidophilum]|uniref:Precorrin-2 C(20)-methyltransferase n=1 Tax=Rhodovulum sulfidophilum TaxID=35806 RepID=A0ABS1RP73_RHOSU|nr:precorrin-2 C(20)-methyltransferase [Rhodovulum sulfidophilum]ANB34379.1 precorrin-2 C(20)-methyltransferase [Rhodovulum sulfidophilum DSM 1374]ANB38202.1 precorrin-2 C(20)-methyltransferase [Rhodovulum sulfidophilum]MBL3607851.1 precorrin-2 C(20)-methyltransferase [Rhodovulum sulfidophilum]MCE8456594.1 precorrin-2 C(20)-methyltransferase [Rhodovulum sulfidophilum]NDK34320.1 precorrin-2 C(20)-methyltransferase [Rhodovulum sulfidophilum]